MARSTFSRVSARTEVSRLMTRETVLSDTPERLATSLMVGLCNGRTPVARLTGHRSPGSGHWEAVSGPVLAYPVATRAVIEDVQVARHHQDREHQLKVEVRFQVREQLRQDRATDNAHDEQRRAKLGEAAHALDRQREDRGPHHGIGKAQRCDEADRDIAVLD